ncbi:uncharacterized protein [Lepeophtheirus salmonis]|uniref:uncharacterized protein isoform X2 n=1 Tax=Lepeophtheirus salmonis TaxID=72036 RepID=UPI001AE8F299|nr:zinc finger protein castor homolog 1-like isoform X2 [Lepeophtheirus salmonis]
MSLYLSTASSSSTSSASASFSHHLLPTSSKSSMTLASDSPHGEDTPEVGSEHGVVRSLESDEEDLPPMEEDDDESEEDRLPPPPPLDDDDDSMDYDERLLLREDNESNDNESLKNNSLCSSVGSSRVNKRKNFRPRNIVYNHNQNSSSNPEDEDDGVEEEESPLNLSSYMNFNKSLLPRKLEEGSPESKDLGGVPAVSIAGGLPMDLSKPSLSSEHQAQKLSLVSRDVLYGGGGNSTPPQLGGLLPPPSGTNPFSGVGVGGVDAMKEAFQEILKLYGVPPELAELIAKNAQNFSGNNNNSGSGVSAHTTPSSQPLISSSGESNNRPLQVPPTFPGGLLSNALLSLSSNNSSRVTLPGGGASHHPPTPPRTPKSSDQSRFSLSSSSAVDPSCSSSKTPPHPFLSLASLNESSCSSSPSALSPRLSMPSQQQPCLSTHLLAGILPGSKTSSADYTRYFKRFSSASDCGSSSCKDLNYREHFHCTVFMCRNRVFAKKEEMIRHAKWHQKLDEAYKYGFRRVTPMDDCTDQFPGCQHNRKQTHYHCIQSESCDKCYISTSDVQMHFNYHRKDNAIQREGFLRYRGHEDCNSPICPFRSQKTTHFHCNRLGCQFIFKNKADMEKHKSYHMKDEQMNEDGFRKYTKQDPCGYSECIYSSKTNHIHCIREGCGYVLNSSGELLTHKRKHERRDASFLKNLKGSLSSHPPPPSYSPFRGDSTLSAAAVASSYISRDANAPPPNVFPPTDMLKDRIPEDAWRNYLLHFEASEICGFQNCDMEESEHYHCKDEGCESIFRSDDGVKDHGRSHYLQDQVSDAFFTRGDPIDLDEEEEDYRENEEKRVLFCPEKCINKILHFHCKWDNCNEIIFNSESPFKRLEHYKIHEYTRKWNLNKVEPISMTQTTNVDTMFKRKRGRPPKNRVVEIPGNGMGGLDNSPQAVFTSFKLPKPGQHLQASSISPITIPHHHQQTTTPTTNINAINNNHSHHHHLSPLSSEALSKLSSAASNSLKTLSAPLGGLPAMASQLIGSPDSPGSSSLAKSPSDPEGMNRDDTASPKGLIKSKGTYYPLTAFPTSMPQGPVIRQDLSPPRNEPSNEETSPPVSLKSKFGVNFMVSFGRQDQGGSGSTHPTESALAKLLQASKDIVGDISAHPLFGPEPEEESCGRPFCKLKRRPHYHCNFCNQGFTERDKLEVHLKKHTAENAKPSIASILQETKQPLPQEALVPKELIVAPSSPPCSSPPASNNIISSSNASHSNPLASSPVPKSSTSPLPFNFPNFLRSSFGSTPPPSLSNSTSTTPSSFPSFLPPNMMLPGFPSFGGDTNSPTGTKSKLPSYDPVQHPLTHLPPNIAEARKRSRSPPSARCLDEEEAKKLRVQAASMKTNKDEPVPEGYMRFRRSFRFNEDCGFEFCNYREHQTHFHCMRKDCNYRFCDKTRFVQHTARHERLDSLCGDEFEGFRGVTCGRDVCEYNIVNMKIVPMIGDTQKSSSHFHCLKCDYYCTDTNKVVAHRRQHQKLDSIMSAGFEKYSPSQFCSFEDGSSQISPSQRLNLLLQSGFLGSGIMGIGGRWKQQQSREGDVFGNNNNSLTEPASLFLGNPSENTPSSSSMGHHSPS